MEWLIALFRRLLTKTSISTTSTISADTKKPEEIVYMISLKELLKGKDFNSLPKEHRDNMMVLLERINKIRTAYGKSMTVTSGYRSMQEHLDIYKRKGIVDQNKIPMQSKHLYGQAVDISDPKGELDAWCQNNVKLLEDVGLWLEHPDYTSGWTHFQVVPPKSGNRFFKP